MRSQGLRSLKNLHRNSPYNRAMEAKMSNKQFLRIEGDAVHLVSERIERTVRLPDFLAESARQAGVLTPVLPTGCRMYYSAGDRSVFVIEQSPAVRQLCWRNMDNGGEQWKLAFPYAIFVVAFSGDAVDTGSCRVFYRTAPLGGADDVLQRVNLCNTYENGRICTGNMRVAGATLAQKAESFVSSFWKSNFNSDLYDNNWAPHAQKFSAVASLSAWQAESAKNPLFPLGLSWLEGPRLSDVIAGRA